MKECNGAQRYADDAEHSEEALADFAPRRPGVVTEPRSKDVTEREPERQKPQLRSLGPGHRSDRRQSQIEMSDGRTLVRRSSTA